MSKVRCSVCKEYVDKDNLYRSQGMTKVCTEECYRNSFQKQSSGTTSKPKPKRTGDPTPATRKKVLKRDGIRCRWCGKQSTHLHHIHYRSEHWPDMHSEINLITLCPEHHDMVHTNKRHWRPVLLAAIWLYYTGETAKVDVRSARKKVMELNGSTES